MILNENQTLHFKNLVTIFPDESNHVLPKKVTDS